MYLQHATPAWNRKSIQDLGLLCSKSQGKRKVVWFHTPSKVRWAMTHTARRHGATDIVLVGASIPRCRLRRRGRGIWYCVVDVPPGKLI